MHSLPKSPKCARRWPGFPRIPRLAGLVLAGVWECAALSPDGEAWLEALRDRMASGLGGQEAYQEALDALAADPDAGCAEWAADGTMDAGRDSALGETLRSVCPGDGAEKERRRPGGPGFGFSGSQAARPAGTGADAPRWSARGRASGASLEAAGRGKELRRRSAGYAAGRFAARWGHWDGALGPTRIASVAGNRAYAGEGASSGVGGPLASAYPGLDGLALTARSGPWRAQAAAAWNRLSDPRAGGNPDVTVRRDAGLVAAGLARSPGHGPDLRAQAFLARLEAAGAPAAWLGVAGAQWAGRGDSWSAQVAGAASAGSARRGACFETRLALRDPDALGAARWEAGPAGEAGWGFRLRQALGAWANPLQSPRLPAPPAGDTVGGWAAAARGAGMAQAETAFPLRRRGTYTAGLRACAAAGWMDARATMPDGAVPGLPASDEPAAADDAILTSGRGEAAWLQAYGPFTLILGAGFGWRRPGSGEPSSDAGRAAVEWHRGIWKAEAAWARRASDYAGGRPMPLDFSLSCRPPAGRAGPDWGVAWSAADALRPWRAHRLDLRQEWQGGNGIRVRQRLRAPWKGTGMGPDLAYQLALEAEF